MARPGFDPLQARTIRDAFRAEGIEFLLLGKGAAILMGFPGTTQDVDVFLPKSAPNGEKVVVALGRLGFELSDIQKGEIVRGKDFIQLKSGPFDLDLIYAPDGLPDYGIVKARSIEIEGYPLVRISDIIASKRATGREKDRLDLPLLEAFERVFRLHEAGLDRPRPLPQRDFPPGHERGDRSVEEGYGPER